VDRPYQTKKPINADNDDLWQASEEALSSISAAMEVLRGYWELDHIFEALGSAYDDLKVMYDEYDAIAAEEQRKEIAALTRDYYRSVI
jgi:transposase